MSKINHSSDCHSPLFMSSHPGGREPDSDTNKGSFRTNLISFILTLFTEKLIKSCFKELVLAYYQV